MNIVSRGGVRTREERNAVHRLRYRTDPEYRARHLRRGRETRLRYAATPEGRAKLCEYSRKFKATTFKEKYHQDPAFRERWLKYERDRKREKYGENQDYRANRQERARVWHLKKYHTDPQYREKLLRGMSRRSKQEQAQLSDAYVRKLLAGLVGPLSAEERTSLPAPLLEAKRAQLKIARQIRQKRKELNEKSN